MLVRARVCLGKCAFEERGVCGREDLGGCHGGGLLCKAGASLINVC